MMPFKLFKLSAAWVMARLPSVKALEEDPLSFGSITLADPEEDWTAAGLLATEFELTSSMFKGFRCAGWSLWHSVVTSLN